MVVGQSRRASALVLSSQFFQTTASTLFSPEPISRRSALNVIPGGFWALWAAAGGLSLFWVRGMVAKLVWCCRRASASSVTGARLPARDGCCRRRRWSRRGARRMWDAMDGPVGTQAEGWWLRNRGARAGRLQEGRVSRGRNHHFAFPRRAGSFGRFVVGVVVWCCSRRAAGFRLPRVPLPRAPRRGQKPWARKLSKLVVRVPATGRAVRMFFGLGFKWGQGAATIRT